MKLDKSKILVTGADGFIGSHLTEALLKDGHEVRALALYNSFGSWGWLDSLEPALEDGLDVFMGDVRDPNGMREAVRGCDVVVHLAALIAIPYSYHSPDAYVQTNVSGTLNLLQAARDLGVKRFIHTSTSEVYGTAQFVPITEQHPLHAQSPYAATKIAADQLALSFHAAFDTPVSVVRPFNTFGPRQSARAVIPTVITQIAAGAESIRLGALTPTRDFSFVSDTVEGMLAVAGSDACLGRTVNLGSGFEISIGDLAELIAEVMDARPDITCERERLRPENSEVERLLADNSLVRELTGWSPAYIGRKGLTRGLAETARWFRNPTNLAGYKTNIYNL